MLSFHRRGKRSREFGRGWIADSDFKIGMWGRISFGFHTDNFNGYSPNCFIAWDAKANTPAGYTRKSIHKTIPHFHWGKAYRNRRFGMLIVWQIQNRIFRFIGSL